MDSNPDLEQLIRAAAKDGSNPDPWYALATVIDSLADDPEEAAYYYKNAIQLAPFNSTYHSGLITMWIDAGKPDLAKECLEVALDLIQNLDDTENHDWLQICADSVIHALWNMDLELAKHCIELVKPSLIKKNSELHLAVMAYMELQLSEFEVKENLFTSRTFTYLPKLPSTRLNSGRYAATL